MMMKITRFCINQYTWITPGATWAKRSTGATGVVPLARVSFSTSTSLTQVRKNRKMSPSYRVTLFEILEKSRKFRVIFFANSDKIFRKTSPTYVGSIFRTAAEHPRRNTPVGRQGQYLRNPSRIGTSKTHGLKIGTKQWV